MLKFYEPGIEPISKNLGSQAEVERFITDLLAYFDRP
jgi:hypothetical protein